MKNGSRTTFAVNKSGVRASLTGEGGFERPIDVKFGPDGAMYITDFGISSLAYPFIIVPNTGVIWKISRS